jgi:hypothetical protein
MAGAPSVRPPVNSGRGRLPPVAGGAQGRGVERIGALEAEIRDLQHVPIEQAALLVADKSPARLLPSPRPAANTCQIIRGCTPCSASPQATAMLATVRPQPS